MKMFYEDVWNVEILCLTVVQTINIALALTRTGPTQLLPAATILKL